MLWGSGAAGAGAGSAAVESTMVDTIEGHEIFIHV
jgi:hypothetical protein